MVILEHMIQEIHTDKWAELEAIDKKISVEEARLGWPPKKRYRMLTGAHTWDTLVIQRQWSSMAELEEVYGKSLADPQLGKLYAETAGIVKSTRVELYSVI